MEPERAARIALARLTARRFGRAVPEPELRRALGIYDVRPLLEELARRGVAFCTPEGWTLTSPPVVSRANERCASYAWLHA